MIHVSKGSILIVLLLAASALCATAQEIRVDATTTGAAVNRGLFSLVNYQYLYGEADGKAISQFESLAPAGSQARIEVRINEAEPENDNGNPAVLNEDAFFPERGIVYVPDSVRFMQNLAELHIEPLVLLAYNSSWLAKDGRFTGAPSSNAEWVEFAVGQIRYLNSIEGGAPIRYVEVWNEPNITQFWTGTQEEYFSLFNDVADALHAEFPGIQVGGPVLSPSGGIDAWIRAFIDACGSRADFLSYHSYGQAVPRIIHDIETYGELFRRETGKTGPRIIISESDHRIAPEDKFGYLMERQFALMQDTDELIAFHHFTLPYYAEGAFVFGLIDTDAYVIPENYWPYWAFRDIGGSELPVSDVPAGVEAVATRNDEGAVALVAYNSGAADTLRATIQLPDDGDRIWTLYRVNIDGPEVVENRPVSAGSTVDFALRLASGEVVVATAKPAETQDDLIASITLSENEVIVGNPVDVTMTIRNTGAVPLRGRLVPVGQPSDWRIEMTSDASFRDLAPGEAFSARARLHPSSATELEGSAVYTFVAYRKPTTRTIRDGSTPVRLKALAPLVFTVLPLQTYAAPGNEYTLEVTAENTFSRDVSGAVSVDAPDGWAVHAPDRYDLPMGETREYTIRFSLPADVQADTYPEAITLSVAFEYDGTLFRETAAVFVREFAYRDSVPVDMSGIRDSDLFTHEDAPADVSNFGGPFSYPAKFYPSNEIVNYLGVDFAFPSTATGDNNGVHADGDRVPVEPGKYDGLAILSAATNGDKTVTFTYVYADGSTETVETTITDWCVNVKHGELEIARAPYRHNPTGILRDAEPRIMFRTMDVDPTKDLVAIELPERTDFWLVAISLIRPN